MEKRGAVGFKTGSNCRGRGGIGIRATLRSLLGKTRGSSNLLDRTRFHF